MVFDFHGLPSPIVNKYIDLFDCPAKKKEAKFFGDLKLAKSSFQPQKMTRNARFRTLQKSSPLGCNFQYLFFEFWKSAFEKKTATSTFSIFPPSFGCFFSSLKKRNNTTNKPTKNETTPTRGFAPIIMALAGASPFDSLLHLRFLTHLSWANATFDELLFSTLKARSEGGPSETIKWGPPCYGSHQNGGGGRFLGFAN